MPTLGPVRLARFLAEFEGMHPGLEVTVREGRPAELRTWLEGDELDAAILNPMDMPADSCRIEPLYTERYVVLLPPAHLLQERNALALNDLDRQPYVDRLAHEMRERVMAAGGEMGVALYARFRSEREDWVQAMVVAGLGFAFMPEHAITHPGALHRPLITPAVERTVALVTMPGRPQSPGVLALVRAARAYRWLA